MHSNQTSPVAAPDWSASAPDRAAHRAWEDLLQVMEELGLPISEKQRNYFLKGT
jgi:hypothetical protein